MGLPASVIEVRNDDWTTNRAAKVVPSVKRCVLANVEITLGIERLIAEEFVHSSMQVVGAGLSRHDGGATPRAWVLGAIVGGEDFDFLNSIETGVNDQGAVVTIQAGIQHFRSVDGKAVVFGAAAIHAIGNAAGHTNLGFVLLRLVADSGDKVNKLGEVTAVQADARHFLAGNRSGYLRILRLYLRHCAGRYFHLGSFRTDCQLHVVDICLPNSKIDGPAAHATEARRLDRNPVMPCGQVGDGVLSGAISLDVESALSVEVERLNCSIRNGCSGRICNLSRKAR